MALTIVNCRGLEFMGMFLGLDGGALGILAGLALWCAGGRYTWSELMELCRTSSWPISVPVAVPASLAELLCLCLPK